MKKMKSLHQFFLDAALKIIAIGITILILVPMKYFKTSNILFNDIIENINNRTGLIATILTILTLYMNFKNQKERDKKNLQQEKERDEANLKKENRIKIFQEAYKNIGHFAAVRPADFWEQKVKEKAKEALSERKEFHLGPHILDSKGNLNSNTYTILAENYHKKLDAARESLLILQCLGIPEITKKVSDFIDSFTQGSEVGVDPLLIAISTEMKKEFISEENMNAFQKEESPPPKILRLDESLPRMIM